VKKILIGALLCLLLGCSRQAARDSAGPSWIVLFEGGKTVGIWKACNVVAMTENRVEFINEDDFQYIVVSGTYIIKPAREYPFKSSYSYQI